MLFDIYDKDWIFLHSKEIHELRDMEIQLTITDYDGMKSLRRTIINFIKWNTYFVEANL